MARGKTLALMDDVENPRDFAGKGNSQVAEQLWKMLHKMEAYVSRVQSICAWNITDLSCCNSHKSQVM